MRVLCLIFSLFLVSACIADAQDVSPEIAGEWVNERGSSVNFVVTEGLLSGYYNTQLGNPDPKSRFPLTGFIEGDQLTFTVNFKGYGSLTSWTGQISEDENGPYIRTLWHLTRDVPDAEEDEDLWSSIIAGNAKFRPIKTDASP